jgi:glycosyltransferase involved in cell wall biosynthesis
MVNKVKTCVYAIALNEIKHVDKFMEASKDADVVLVCDTGSTDGTVERLRELGAVVHCIKQQPWRFDVPRNTALNLIPSDIDICLSIDLD